MRLSATVFLLILSLGTLQGAPVSWRMSGVITRVNQPFAFWDSSVAPGQPFTVISTFDSSASDRHSHNPAIGYFAEPEFATTLSLGGYRFSHRTTFINVLDNLVSGNSTRDGYDWMTFDFAQAGLTNVAIQAHLHSFNTNLIAGDALDIQEFPIDAFDIQHNLILTGVFEDQSGFTEVHGTFTSYAVTIIPEPAPSALFLLSVAALALWKRRCE